MQWLGVALGLVVGFALFFLSFAAIFNGRFALLARFVLAFFPAGALRAILFGLAFAGAAIPVLTRRP